MNDESRHSWVERVFRVDTDPRWMLVLLTIFAAAIRFFHISHPPLWYDESMVFRRTCGTYGQLLDCLRTDGFVPLHYSLVWVVSRFFKLTPLVLRFLPALCGTVMAPAVYFLARQLLPIRTSLLAAAFTACSAFMLFYSRDAKMYMDSWLFVTLNAGCLLWWFRVRRATAWLCWIASGCAACGLHASSAIPVAISSLLLLTEHRLRWQETLLWVAGVILIFAGPIGYYEKFNLWKDNVEEVGWQRSQLEWINAYNYGRSGPELARFLGTTFLMGWEWPREDDIAQIPTARVTWPAHGAECLAVILLVGCLPWPLRWRGGSKVEIGDEPQWRVALWLCLWVLIPAYGFYCRSMPGFASPADWWQSLSQEYPIVAHLWIWIAIGLGLLVLVCYGRTRAATLRAVQLLAVFAVVIGLCQVMAIVMASLAKAAVAEDKPWESLWVPRYIGFIWPMLAIAVASLLMRLPTRWVRIGAIVFLLGLNLGIGSYRIFGQTEPPVDLMAADHFYAGDSSHHSIFWTHLRQSAVAPGRGNIYGQPGQYYLQLLENEPTDPVQFLRSVRQREREYHGLRAMPWDRWLAPDIKQIIFWSEYDASGNVLAIEPRVPPGWSLQSDQWFTARDCWIWKDLARYRRSVYVKASE